MNKFAIIVSAIALTASTPACSADANTEQLSSKTCLAKLTKPEKLDCFAKLKQQRGGELAIATTKADKAEAEADKLDVEISGLEKAAKLQKDKQDP